MVDEDEQNIDNLEIAMSLQFGLDKVDENSNVKMVFMNLGPMVVAEKGRKAGEQTRQSTVTTLMSHFRLLRNTIESFGEVSIFFYFFMYKITVGRDNAKYSKQINKVSVLIQFDTWSCFIGKMN